MYECMRKVKKLAEVGEGIELRNPVVSENTEDKTQLITQESK